MVCVLPSTRILTFAATAAGGEDQHEEHGECNESAKHESSFREGFG